MVMADRPILFSGPMVRAILDGRKTMTRRVLKTVKGLTLGDLHDEGVREGNTIRCARHQVQEPAYAPGDRLWVKERWNAFAFSQDGDEAWPTKTIPTAEEMREIREEAYRVDVQAVYFESDRAREWFADQPWRPSIHMPRWASRLTLIVTDVRIQRLQEISADDTLAEGSFLRRCPCSPMQARETTPIGISFRQTWCHEHGEEFSSLWDSLNATRGHGWDANPWVAAITFDAHRCNIDHMPTPPQEDA